MQKGSSHSTHTRAKQSASQRAAHARRKASGRTSGAAISAAMKKHHAQRRQEGKSSSKAISKGVAAYQKAQRLAKASVPVAVYHRAEFARYKAVGVDMDVIDAAVSKLLKEAKKECASISTDRREDAVNRAHRRKVDAWLSSNKEQLAMQAMYGRPAATKQVKQDYDAALPSKQLESRLSKILEGGVE